MDWIELVNYLLLGVATFFGAWLAKTKVDLSRFVVLFGNKADLAKLKVDQAKELLTTAVNALEDDKLTPSAREIPGIFPFLQ